MAVLHVLLHFLSILAGIQTGAELVEVQLHFAGIFFQVSRGESRLLKQFVMIRPEFALVPSTLSRFRRFVRVFVKTERKVSKDQADLTFVLF